MAYAWVSYDDNLFLDVNNWQSIVQDLFLSAEA